MQAKGHAPIKGNHEYDDPLCIGIHVAVSETAEGVEEAEDNKQGDCQVPLLWRAAAGVIDH